MIRIGQRVRMVEDYWFKNKGREGVISRFTISPLDDTLSGWVLLDGDFRDHPMPPTAYEVITSHE